MRSDHAEPASGTNASRDDVAALEADGSDVPPTPDATRATPEPTTPASPFVSGASGGSSLPPPDDDAGLLCAIRSFDPSRRDNTVSLIEPCSFRGDWRDQSSPIYLRVIVGGVRRAAGEPSDGYRFEADRHTLTLLGAACEEVQAGAPVTLEFLCEWLPLI